MPRSRPTANPDPAPGAPGSPQSGPARRRGGRVKGSKNKSTLAREAVDRAISQRIAGIVEIDELIRLLWTIAQGERRVVLNRYGKPTEVKDAPDGATARYLMDRFAGKPPTAETDPLRNRPKILTINRAVLGIPDE